MSDLWVDKYRSSKLEDYVFRNPLMKTKILEWITDGSIDGHLLLTGSPGTGKTTLALMLMNILNVPAPDWRKWNTSQNNGIDHIRSVIIPFASSMPQGEYRYIILDEADRLSQEAQDCLRAAMEDYSDQSRFILTGNKENLIDPALKSRMQRYHFDSLDKEEFLSRLVFILSEENISFDLPVLEEYMELYYPDMRKSINTLQQNTVSNVLQAINKDDVSPTTEYMIRAYECFIENDIKAGRTIIANEAKLEDYDEIYKFMYQNVEFWGDDDDQIDTAILILRNAVINHRHIADPELNLSACIIELKRIRQNA